MAKAEHEKLLLGPFEPVKQNLHLKFLRDHKIRFLQLMGHSRPDTTTVVARHISALGKRIAKNHYCNVRCFAEPKRGLGLF